MSTIPGNLTRVPTLLASTIQLGAINRTSIDVVELQNKLSSGKRLNRPSDDVIGSSAVSVLDDRLERRDQRLRNLSAAESLLNNVDGGLADVNELLLEAKGIAVSQVGATSDGQTRQNQAAVVDALIAELTNIANRDSLGVQLFGGRQTDREPFVDARGGIRYRGSEEKLYTDLGLARSVPVNVTGAEAFGAVTARVQGSVDLDPPLLATQRLEDLAGARGLGVSLGTLNVDVNGTDLQVDLSDAHTVQDVLDTLEAEIQTVDAGATVDIDPVGLSGIRIVPTAGTITVSDQASPATAADLGLAQAFPLGGAVGGDLDPFLTEDTRLDDLAGLPSPLGSIRLENLGLVRDVDLTSIETVRDLINVVEGLDIGIRVTINADRDRIEFRNEASGGSMSIGEVSGGTVAADLGIRTFDVDTELSEFNDGRGVQFVTGGTDPVSGAPDPTRDLDFEIETKDGTTFSVDIASATTVQDVLDLINAGATAAGLTVGTDFEARLADTGNGIVLEDATNGGVGTIEVRQLNGSYAAEDLGILGSSDGATHDGADRARVAVDGAFAHLIALRDALRANDERGITIAGGQIDEDIARTAEVRAEVGVRARRVRDANEREEDLKIMDLGLRSEVQDLDFAEAAVQFGLLQRQLQAGLTSASQLTQLSLLDFLG